MLKPVMLPVHGVSNARSFIDTPGDMAPYALDADGKPIMRNIVPFTPGSKDRHVLGSRAGHSLLFPQQCGGLGGAAWQELIPVAISSTLDGYTVGTCTVLTADDSVSVESGAIVGNYFQVDSVPSMDGVGALETGGVSASAVCPALQGSGDGYYLCFVATTYTGGSGFTEAKIRCFRDDTGATVWEYTISSATANKFINTMTCSDGFLFVCTNAVVLMLRVTDGSLVATETMGGWAQETIEAGVYKTAAGAEWLFVGFNGSEVAGRTQDEAGADVEPITAGDHATHFRAGVMRFQIGNEYVNPTGPYAGDPLTRDTYGWGQTLDAATGLTDNSDTDFNEGFHGYFRVSERSMVEGHGCLITALAVDSRDGSIIVGRTNQGYGPNSDYPPDGLSYTCITVFKISFDGELEWEMDVGSLLSTEVGHGGYANDIPTSATDDPTISQVRVSRLGMVCAAGRQTESGFNTFGIDTDDGTLQWTLNLTDSGLSMRQAAIAVDPGDGAFVLGGDVNDAWEGSGSDDAHLWKVNALTGAVMWDYLIDVDVSVLAVSMMPDGSLVVGTDYVS